ncbi:unnamed protein product [Brassica oleracea]|uniref:(rape) hypothetical protein n=1 Tax=Brassica napus TaxID=3708 RepID=A0A816K9V1_BRANA|nr:unnamed protein product [Brassica napus]
MEAARRQREERRLSFEARSLDLVLWPRGSSGSGSALEASSATDLWVGFGHAKPGEVNDAVQFGGDTHVPTYVDHSPEPG